MSGGNNKTSRLPVYAVVIIVALGGGVFALYQRHQQELSDQAVAGRSYVADVRRLAVESGADQLGLESFGDADQWYRAGEEKLNMGEYKAATEIFSASVDLFKESRLIASGVQAGLEAASRLKEKARELGASVESPDWAASVKALDDAQQAIQVDDISRALVQIKTSFDAFNTVISRSPRKFIKGSDASEMKAALELCNQYMDKCDERWYRTEILKEVLLKPYHIDPYEVTNSEFAEFVEQTDYITEAEQRGYSYLWDGNKSNKVKGASWRLPGGEEEVGDETGKFPVTHITFSDARAYCKWREGRIPTESEWEYSARGLERNIFPWGNRWDESQVQISKVGRPAANKPVGSYPAAFSGSKGYDFSGSVWEWVWQDTGKKPVLKGGSHLETNPANFRSAAAKVNPAGVSQSDDGFRCVTDVEEWPTEMSTLR